MRGAKISQKRRLQPINALEIDQNLKIVEIFVPAKRSALLGNWGFRSGTTYNPNQNLTDSWAILSGWLDTHLAGQSTCNCNGRERVVLPKIHGRHHQRRLDELFHRMNRAQHAVLCGEHDSVGNLYKLPKEREVL